MVVILSMLLACGDPAPPPCDDACHADRAVALVDSDFPAAMAELDLVSDPVILTAVTLELSGRWDLKLSASQAQQLCTRAAAAGAGDLCQRRFGRPHLNAPVGESKVEGLLPQGR